MSLRSPALYFALAAFVGGSVASTSADSIPNAIVTPTTIPYSVAPRGYLVSNKTAPKPRTFFVIHDVATFGSIFRYGMTEGPRPKLIGAADFDTHMVFAVVMRGPICNLHVSTITAVGTNYTVAYTMMCDSPMPTGEYDNPMIISVPAGRTTSVTFVENGETQAVIDRSATPLPG